MIDPQNPKRRHIAFADVSSTNTLAFDAARAGDPGPLWVTAERQLSGRGRLGRQWVSETGNLYASLLLLDPAPWTALANLPLVIAVGLRAGLASVSPRPTGSLQIKWPNDILCDGAKCCGILIESERLTDGRQVVVVGMGVNVAHTPDHSRYPVTGLRDEGVDVPLEQIFEAVADGVEDALRIWDRGRNFLELRAEWLNHATGIGQPCRVTLSDRVLSGRFVGLASDGRLILEQGDGTCVNISAGDVFFSNHIEPI